jgi:predicted RNase H-like HicB family nuclease
MNRPQYTVVIQWSEEDQAYVVSLPEWGSSCKTHGATYEGAARNASELLEMLIESHDVATQGPLPQPHPFHYPGAAIVDLSADRDGARSSGMATSRV